MNDNTLERNKSLTASNDQIINLCLADDFVIVLDRKGFKECDDFWEKTLLENEKKRRRKHEMTLLLQSH